MHKNEAFRNISYQNYVLRYKSLQLQEIDIIAWRKWIIAWRKQLEVFCRYANETPKVSEKMSRPLENGARLLAPLSYHRNKTGKLESTSTTGKLQHR